MNKKKNPHAGSSFDAFLAEEGLLDSADARALKRAISLQVRDAMQRQSLTKTTLAARMSTSRAAVDRLLDSENSSVTLGTLSKAAHAVGGRIKIELVA
jgi:DNA-binding Xre family transcriptional regulator